MSRRAPAVARFLESVSAALESNLAPGDAPRPVVERMLTALASPGESSDAVAAGNLSVLEHLPPALRSAASSRQPVGDVGTALTVLAPELDWRRRPGANAVGMDFAEGHANAVVVGAEGVERRRDVTVGLSLMAPGVRYPDHNHPPEEVYLVLSPGEWWQEGGGWHEPGVGAIVHNPPGIMHAMRAGDAPLLAVWLLWMEG